MKRDDKYFSRLVTSSSRIWLMENSIKSEMALPYCRKRYLNWSEPCLFSSFFGLLETKLKLSFKMLGSRVSFFCLSSSSRFKQNSIPYYELMVAKF